MPKGPQGHTYEVNAMLKVAKASEHQIGSFLAEHSGVKPSRIQSDLHLTVYHGRRPLPGLAEGVWPIDVVADTNETRFMVLAPGGENPRPELDHRSLSVGIRLTRRNRAIAEIQRLRKSVYSFESPEIVGGREATTEWTNCFGSRHYQPHVQLLKPWNKMRQGLTELGALFRSTAKQIHFDEFRIESRTRVDGRWVAGTLPAHSVDGMFLLGRQLEGSI